MYKNYGDVNFFEYGRMAEMQNDGTVDVLVAIRYLIAKIRTDAINLTI